MLTNYDFEDISNEFGAAVGVATFLKERFDDELVKKRVKWTDDMLVNEIILDSIDFEDYRELRLDVLRMERQTRRGTKELTIYKKVLELEEEEDEK